MEMLEFGDWGAALDILKKTLKRNKDYIELYVGLASVYRMIEDNKSFEKIVEVGFEKLKDKFPEWPKKMFWGYINNRQFLRIIDFKACLCFEKGDKKQAEKLYKLLLKLNPNDNQGIRYFLAGLYENISPKEIHSMFEEGNKKQDWDKIENLFDRQNKIYKFFKYEEEKNENEIVDNNKKNGFYWKIN